MIKLALAIFTMIFLIQIAASFTSNNNFELGNNITLNYNGLQWEQDNSNLFQGRPSFTSGDIECPDSSSVSSKIMGPGQLYFAWKKSSNTTRSVSDYSNFSFYVDNVKQASCGKSVWENESFPIGNDSHTVKWEFKLDRTANSGCPRDSHGQGWIAFINYIGENVTYPKTVTPAPPTPKLNQVVNIIDWNDLKKRTESSCDLMGAALLLDDGPYVGNLIINAKNFTLKPNNGRKGQMDSDNGKFNIELNHTSKVIISQLIL